MNQPFFRLLHHVSRRRPLHTGVSLCAPLSSPLFLKESDDKGLLRPAYLYDDARGDGLFDIQLCSPRIFAIDSPFDVSRFRLWKNKLLQLAYSVSLFSIVFFFQAHVLLDSFALVGIYPVFAQMAAPSQDKQRAVRT